MAPLMSGPGPKPALLGRRRECEALDRLLANVRAGQSRALLIRGDAGMGKTALLEYLCRRASGCRLARAAGVESEMELAFAGLHQLCAPFLSDASRLPAPQAAALEVAFGLTDGEAPDRFLVGLAVLSLLCLVAEERPLIAVIDDAQWLDHASMQALTFATRRLLADPVGLVFASRPPGGQEESTGLEELKLQGLQHADARALLESALTTSVDERVRERMVAETHGNPLALLELPRGLGPEEIAGGFGLTEATAVSSRIEESFLRRIVPLPGDTRLLLLVAAAEPLGDPVIVLRAAERLGVPAGAAAPAAEAGLIELGGQVRFRHPLVRSVIYRTASIPDRQRVHGALAQATDPDLDPDHRAWHRARATAGLDEDVAADLERSADRAQARGGIAAAAAFLERAAELTPAPARRAERSLDAAQSKHQAGAPDTASRLLAIAQAGPLDEFGRARAELLRAQIAFTTTRGRDAPLLLLNAAKRLETVDATLARETYLDAWAAALFAGHLARGADLEDVSRAARRAPPPANRPRPCDLLLDALALMITEGAAAAANVTRQAGRAFVSDDVSLEEELRWGWLAAVPLTVLWDFAGWRDIQIRQVRLARDAGFVTTLPVRLAALAYCFTMSGDFPTAASLIGESETMAEATGIRSLPQALMTLDALRGRESVATQLVEATHEGVSEGEGHLVSLAQWAAAIRYNALGRYAEALAAAQHAVADTTGVHVEGWALAEQIEAAARTGDPKLAGEALGRLAATTGAGGMDWGLGIEARSRALLSDGAAAELLYREAIDRLGRAQLRPDLGRAHLLYGEWLRRQQRRVDAREQLRIAYALFTDIGAQAFAERTRRELLATGETVRRRSAETVDDLTAQEQQIAQLAADGATNSEIGARLFLSSRTVEWHLRKVYGKLGITSRKGLAAALGAAGGAAVPA